MAQILPILVVVALWHFAPATCLVCYECLEGEYTQLCNLTATLTRCQNIEDVCFTQVKTSPDDVTLLTSHKTCINRQTCEAERTRNPAHCAAGVISSVCTWCCEQDQCNYDRVSYVTGTTTTPVPPSTTTAVPTHTDTDCVPVATGNCTDLDLQQCVVQYTEDFHNFPDDGDAKQICRSIPGVLSCLSDALETCYHPGDQGGVVSLLDNVVTSLLDTCPSRCNKSALIQCSYRLVSRVIQIILSPGGSCELLTREVEAHVHCVALTISTCDADVRTRYEHISALLKASVTTVCHVLPSSIHPPITSNVGPMSTSNAPGSRFTVSGVSRVTSFSSRPSTTTPAARSTSTRPQSTASRSVTTSTPTATTTPTLPPPTEHPECRDTVATACITELAHELVQLMTEENPDYSEICSRKFIEKLECARSNTEKCSAFVQNRIEIAIQYVQGLLGGACLVTTTPPGECDTQTARKCLVDLLTLAADSDPRRACLFRANASACVERYTAGCTPDERESLETALGQILVELTPRCEEIVQCADEDIVIVIREGGGSHDVHFSFITPPSDLCNNDPDCKIFVDFLPDDTKQSPRCRNSRTARQFVVGDVNQDTSGAETPLCSREITDGNWGREHSVSLTAIVDLVRDGDQTRHFNIVLRKVVNGVEVARWTVCTYLILIIDGDTNSVCKVLNDPHIHTFDKTFYNNHYQGIFRLYQHDEQPYEVQAAFVQCFPGGPATCTCAVYVRAGDTVFVADKCNTRKNNQQLRTALYANDFVTPGMRIHSSANGRIFDIILPHGTRVRINDAETTLLNIYIYPSPYDWEHTIGLCGVYDGDRDTDLVDSFGHFHDLNIIKTSWNKMPKELCASWRVPRDEYLVGGYHGDAHVISSLCLCQSSMDQPDGAVLGTCGPEALVESCRLRLGREVSRRYRPRQPRRRPPRGKRQLSELPDEDLVPDFDEEFDPTLVEFESTWSLEEARAYCWEYLMGDDLVQNCLTVPGINLDFEMDICIEDILYTGNTTWAPRARESLLESCEHELRTNSVYTDTSVGATLAAIVLGKMCPSDCSGFGECVQGECICTEGRFGADCSLKMGFPPNVREVVGGSLCPSDVTDCSIILISGERFSETRNMSCNLEQIWRLTTDSMENVLIESDATLLSHQTISCTLPRANQSYKIKVTLDGTSFSEELIFVPFNSQCFSCDIVDGADVSCTQTAHTCLVEGTCYLSGEHHPQDSCAVCDPGRSPSALSSSKGIQCASTKLIIIVVFCVVAGLVIIGVIVCCVCAKKRSKSRIHRMQDESATRMSAVKVTSLSDT